MKTHIKRKTLLTVLSILMMLSMLLGIMPLTARAFFDGDSLDVCTEGKTYSLFTEDNLEEQNGTTFLYVVKSGDRYYTPGNPRYTEFKEVDSVYAVDITEYYDAQTNTFSGISNSVNVGAMQYQMNAGSYMYVDGDMLLALSVPFESEGETWFDGGIRYYSPEETYSYSRPLWHANGDGSGYLYDSYIDWIGDSDTWVYGVLDLKYTGTNYVFALRDKSEEYNEVRSADPDNYDVGVNVKAYLYAAPCGHEQNVHGDADAPTCMEKGCKEYWYCRLCDTYFSNEGMTAAYEGFPEIDALDHDWNGEKCNNCNRPVPVYSKVTNKTDFFALADDTMYVLVAEYEGKYYTPDSSVLYSYVFDLDGDGYADIYNVDENNNGAPDILEIDWNTNGVYDYLEECETEEELKEYFDSICHGYLTDMLYGQTVGIPVKEITLHSDGTISHDAVKDALEFEMIKLHSQEEIDGQEEVFRYTYECVVQFVIPNTFINSPAFIPEDRPYNKLYPDEGDTYYWAVLFYNDRDSYYTYDWENDEYVGGLEFLDICKEGSVALSKSWNAFSPEFGEQLGCLRLRDYNGELRFVVGNDYDLEGSEYIDDENGGYWDTNDTQACVYLYASAPYQPAHTCDFGDWYDTEDGNHRRDCKDSACEKFESEAHGFGAWSKLNDTQHKRECDKCDAEESANHDFTAPWTKLDGEYHTHECKAEGCDATEKASHTFGEWGEYAGFEGITRHCTADGCDAYETKPAEPPHVCNFGDWMPDPNNDMKHIRKCECGASESGDHTYGDWTMKDEIYHTHSCPTCGASEDFEHSLNDWIAKDNNDHIHDCMECDYESILPHDYVREVTKEPTATEVGEVTYTCSLCSHFYTEELPKKMVQVSGDVVGTVLNVPAGSNAYIPEGTVFDVVEMPTEQVPEQVLGEIAVTAEGAAKPLGMFDLSLLLEGAKIQPDGKVEITLPAPDLAAEYDEIIVVYIAPDGSYEECKTTVNEDGTITFETDHFSQYAIIGITEDAGLGTGAIVGIVVGSVVVLGLGGFALVWFVIKKKTWAEFLAIFKKK
ncbi:MAG: hypothetical protein IKA57_06125 [Clostridia bacterium]|nr:hypothetical protein [Clostridia bacterium]